MKLPKLVTVEYPDATRFAFDATQIVGWNGGCDEYTLRNHLGGRFVWVNSPTQPGAQLRIDLASARFVIISEKPNE